MLAAARVLEFIYKKVPDAVSDLDCGVVWQTIFARKDPLSDLGHFNEVQSAGFSEYDLQFSCGLAEKRETCAHNVPVFFCVTGGWKGADAAERSFKAVYVFQVGDQPRKAGLFCFAIRWKAVVLVDLNSECSVFGEREVGETEKRAVHLLE
jgi:hypothetical protein